MCKGMFNVQHVFYLSSLPGLDDMALLSLLCCPSCTRSKQHVRFLDIVSNSNAWSLFLSTNSNKEVLAAGHIFKFS